MSIIGFIGFILILGTIVLVHELGHLIVAKRNGVYCHEFSIGMGPKIMTLKTDKSGIVYNLRWIPIGGYVQMAGEDTGLEIDEAISDDKKFDGKTKWSKFKILVAGASMNFILGILLFFIVGFFGGVSDLNSLEVGVIDSSPAFNVGIENKDEIIAINNKEVNNFLDIQNELQQSGNKVNISYKTNEGKIENKDVEKKDGKIGITTYRSKFKIFASIKYSISKFIYAFTSVFYSLYLLMTPAASLKDLSGPVGIAILSNGVISLGIISTLSWMAFLSINIGVINLLPIPALDGGRIFFLLIELIRKKPMNKELEAKLNNIVFFLLLALIIFVTFQDIFRIDDLKNIFN